MNYVERLMAAIVQRRVAGLVNGIRQNAVYGDVPGVCPGLVLSQFDIRCSSAVPDLCGVYVACDECLDIMLHCGELATLWNWVAVGTAKGDERQCAVRKGAWTAYAPNRNPDTRVTTPWLVTTAYTGDELVQNLPSLESEQWAEPNTWKPCPTRPFSL